MSGLDRPSVEEKLATVKNRRAVKDLLGDAVDRGRNLQRMIRKEGDEIKLVSQQDVEDWVHHTRDLIEAAFDKGEARHFLSGEGYNEEGVRAIDNAYMRRDTYSIPVRLWRLDELIVRANSLEIDPSFDPQYWTE